MKKFFNKIHNNKGFTLVELVIVIAVLGVITVLAIPQFTKYIEKSRAGTDENAIWEVAHAAEVAYVDQKCREVETVKVRIHDDGTVKYASANDGIESAVEKTMPSYVYKSEKFRGNTYTIDISENGVAKISGIDTNLNLGQILDDQKVTIFGQEKSLKEIANKLIKEATTERGGFLGLQVTKEGHSMTEDDWEEVSDKAFEYGTDLEAIKNDLENNDVDSTLELLRKVGIIS